MSLHELLVALALCGGVMAAIYAVLDQGLRAHAVGAARVESQQAARVALNRLAREIRGAGRGPEGATVAVAVAERARIVVASDLDGNRDTDARGEQITWQLVGSVLRRNAGAGAQPVANGVRALELRYFDAAGRPTGDPAAVHAVEVVLVTVADGAASVLARGVATRLSTRVRLRNR